MRSHLRSMRIRRLQATHLELHKDCSMPSVCSNLTMNEGVFEMGTGHGIIKPYIRQVNLLTQMPTRVCTYS